MFHYAFSGRRQSLEFLTESQKAEVRRQETKKVYIQADKFIKKMLQEKKVQSRLSKKVCFKV